jgi:hypothetical protein
MNETTLLAVNGTLMRGLELNGNMTAAGGVFVREDHSEPAGLAIGKVTLKDGSQVLGVLAEPWLVENQKDITQYGSWRVYTGHFHIT